MEVKMNYYEKTMNLVHRYHPKFELNMMYLLLFFWGTHSFITM
jgi:hypothetical protein